MPNEGYKHEMAPEEENRAQPKTREQIVDLLAVCYTCTYSLSLSVALPHCKHHPRLVLQLSALRNNFAAQTGRFFFPPKIGITGGNAEIVTFFLSAVNSIPAKAPHLLRTAIPIFYYLLLELIQT